MDQGMNNSYGPITFLDVITSSGREAIRQHSNGCTEANVPQPLTVGETDFYIQHYVFPVQFILGFAGNCINLIVLLGSGMKNQVSVLLLKTILDYSGRNLHKMFLIPKIFINYTLTSKHNTKLTNTLGKHSPIRDGIC
jgi:hypothetical protein